MQYLQARLLLLLIGFVISVSGATVYAHGDVQPQAVDTTGLEPLGDTWRERNPYSGNETAIEIGASAYNQNCARCHGLGGVSGGIAPDLRLLPYDADGDAWYVSRVRNGAIRNGVTYMPKFEGVLSQEALWAIRAWLETVPADKSAVLAVVCAAASFTQAASSRLDDIREVGEITVAVYENFPPFSFREGNQLRGIDVEIAREFAAKIGVKPAIRVVGADESVEDDLRNNVWKGHYLGGGVADVMLHVPFDRELQQRNDRVRLVGAYYREQLVIALSSEHHPHSDVLELFTREKVGVELDTLADFYLLTANGGRIRNNVVHYTNVADAVTALLQRRLAGVMAPRSEIEGAAGKRSDELVLVEPGRLPGLLRTGWDLGLAVKQEHDALAEAVQTAVGELHSTGRLAEIFAAYGVTYQPASETRF